MKIKQFAKFALVGGIATGIDWGLFYILALKLNLYYQLSLIISFSSSAIFNYSFNKIFTFKSKSKKIIKQFFTFFVLSIIALLLSMLLMFIFIEVVSLEKMFSRILTTAIILFFNYAVHRSITFNKRFFS